MPKKSVGRFPKKFLWGAATSAHQVEGGTHNQWSQWELENAKSLAAQSEYQYDDTPNWSAVKTEAKQPANYVSGRGVQHYMHYETDFDLLREMNMNAFRFSVEWSRIEPQEGAWDSAAIEHYRRYIAELKKRDIEPVVTLFHFTLPIWFAEMGGFEKRGNIKYFVRFAEKIIAELGIQVKYIITINEPEVYAIESYYEGNWPPQQQSKRVTYRVLKNLAQAHNQAAAKIHALNRRYKVSIAANISYVYPGDDASLSIRYARIHQYLRNDYFLKKVVKRCDFIGVNYYFSDRVYGYRVHNPEDRVSDLGWDLAPENLEFVLKRVHEKYKRPIMITENGLADSVDAQREWWLKHTIVAMKKAIDDGVDLIGYMHWSLLDNFEWDKGFWPKFGLATVDRRTGERTLRPSARWFGSVIAKLKRKT